MCPFTRQSVYQEVFRLATLSASLHTQTSITCIRYQVLLAAYCKAKNSHLFLSSDFLFFDAYLILFHAISLSFLFVQFFAAPHPPSFAALGDHLLFLVVKPAVPLGYNKQYFVIFDDTNDYRITFQNRLTHILETNNVIWIVDMMPPPPQDKWINRKLQGVLVLRSLNISCFAYTRYTGCSVTRWVTIGGGGWPIFQLRFNLESHCSITHLH
jgi:hypothetical protein